MKSSSNESIFIEEFLSLSYMQVDCTETDPFVLDTDQQLGRIEVFNSLAVIAPQIELDRLRSDRRYNVTSMYLNIDSPSFLLSLILILKTFDAFSFQSTSIQLDYVTFVPKAFCVCHHQNWRSPSVF